jgi:hypothetical protein
VIDFDIRHSVIRSSDPLSFFWLKNAICEYKQIFYFKFVLAGPEYTDVLRNVTLNNLESDNCRRTFTDFDPTTQVNAS